jgi:spore maturation protein CgeB
VDIYTGSDTSSLPRLHNKGFAKTLTEMPIIFHESRINLNITAKSIRSGIPLRVFDILGCEGFMLCNYQTEVLEHFTPGTDLDIYTDMEDLEEKAAYYMDHPDICREIAHNGYEKVLQFHNYPLRLTQMFELAFPASS